MQSFYDLFSLDNYLSQLDAAAKVSDDELRSLFKNFEWRRPRSVENDPYSPAYREEQMEIYCKLASLQSYDTTNERSHFDVDEAVRCPSPYRTGSPETVGDHLISIGFLLKTAGIRPGSRVLEFGPGWGNTTLALAQLGCRLTVVDIEPNFIELIQRRIKAVGLEVEAIQGDFNTLHGSGRQFDAVIFFECFHHCSDHLKLLRGLGELVSPGGLVVFAGEPITDTFPVPWGVRLDGMSVWSIRRFRWLELGFQESYFVRTLMRLGWSVSKHVTDASTVGTIHLARRFQGTYSMGCLLLPPDEDATWAPAANDRTVGVRFTAGDSHMTLDDSAAWGRATVELINGSPFPMEISLTAGGRETKAKVKGGDPVLLDVELCSAPRVLRLQSPAWVPKKVGLNSDDRKLGFAVRRIQLQPQ